VVHLQQQRELARYILDLLGTEEVRWDKGGTVRAGIVFFYERRRNNHLGAGYFVVYREETAVKRVEIVGDRMS